MTPMLGQGYLHGDFMTVAESHHGATPAVATPSMAISTLGIQYLTHGQCIGLGFREE